MAADAGWRADLEEWLRPFLGALGHPARQAMCPLYVAGLIGPGDRKSVQPMAERLGLPGHDALHHFIAAGVWDAGPLETALAQEADRLVGGGAGSSSSLTRRCPRRGCPRRGCPRRGCPRRARARSASPRNTHPPSARPRTARPSSRSPSRGARCRFPSRCGCSCRRSGRGMPRAWRGRACPATGARPAPSPRSRSPRSTAPWRPGCGSAPFSPMRATASARRSEPG